MFMTIKNDLKLVVFDLDGTLTKEHNSWGLIHSKLGVEKEAKKNSDLFFSNKIDYFKWAELDINLWKNKGLTSNKLKEIIYNNIKPFKGAKKTIQILKNRNIETLVISSGISMVCEYFKKILDFDNYISNELYFDENNRLKGIKVKVGFNKDVVLQQYIIKKNIPIDKVASIGDNINDIRLFQITPLSIAINPKDISLKKYATYTLYTNNLKKILSLLL